ncbi:MAG: lysophospholipid acyltransferase family protein [Nitrospirota bacterium]
MKQKILNSIIPLSAYLLAKWVNKTLKIKVIGEEEVRQLKQEGKKLIYAFWHGRQFMLVSYLSHHQIAVMTSLSRDGEYQSRILKRFGCRIVRGSYTRGGVRGLLGLIKEIRAGYDVGFAVDGPTGPVYEVKEGVIYAAKKEKGYIVPLTTSAKKSWIFQKAWDKYLLPHPFTQGIIIFGEPYQVSKEADIKQECKILKERLEAITKQADEFFV